MIKKRNFTVLIPLIPRYRLPARDEKGAIVWFWKKYEIFLRNLVKLTFGAVQTCAKLVDLEKKTPEK